MGEGWEWTDRHARLPQYCASPPVRQRSIVMCTSVCLSVRPHSYLSISRHVFTVLVTRDCSSVSIWRRCGMSCISGPVDDVVTFARNSQAQATREKTCS